MMLQLKILKDVSVRFVVVVEKAGQLWMLQGIDPEKGWFVSVRGFGCVCLGPAPREGLGFWGLGFRALRAVGW